MKDLRMSRTMACFLARLSRGGEESQGQQSLRTREKKGRRSRSWRKVRCSVQGTQGSQGPTSRGAGLCSTTTQAVNYGLAGGEAEVLGLQAAGYAAECQGTAQGAMSHRPGGRGQSAIW